LTRLRAALYLAPLCALGLACEHNRTAELVQQGRLELACFENRKNSESYPRDRELEDGLARALRDQTRVRVAFHAISPTQLAALHGDHLALQQGRWLVIGSFELLSTPARGVKLSFWLDTARSIGKGRPSLLWTKEAKRPAGPAAAGLPAWLSWFARQPASMPGQQPAEKLHAFEKTARLEGLLRRLADAPCQLQLPGERCDLLKLVEGADGAKKLRIALDHVLHYAPRGCRVDESLEVPLSTSGDLGAKINRLTPNGPRLLRELKPGKQRF
jgi:hypothetical protein